MKFTAAALALLASTTLGTAFAAEGPVPPGAPVLDHVFVIMLENHGYNEILNNPNAPFINAEYATKGVATNYYGVAHPSLTNYLETVGGSNFGVTNDHAPDWHSTTCTTALASGVPSNEANPGLICPITGTGTETATTLLDFSNETTGQPGDINIDMIHSFPALTNISGKTIADQLVEAKKTWKTYQEFLPLSGADGMDYSNGFFTNKTDFSKSPASLGLSTSAIVQQYRSKHNPFVYFASIQGTAVNGQIPGVEGFNGANGLYADLATGKVPAFSFIAPGQCNDMHGQGNGGVFCNYDPANNGTQSGLNDALIQQGDQSVQTIVTAIKASPVWAKHRSAIVIVWDENDYSTAPITNQVMLIVDKNYGQQHYISNRFYTHYSLLKSIESGLRLPCLNHACDHNVASMSDLFSR